MATERVQERFVYGMTIDEVDRLLELNRRITATNDIFANGGADFANEKSVHALGQAAYENGLSIHEMLNGLRKLEAVEDAPPALQAAGQAARPPFAMHSQLLHAESIAQVLNTAAYQAENAEGMGGTCWALATMLQDVIEYVEKNFDYAPAVTK